MKQRDSRSDRWERENAAPRLKQLVPEIAALRLNLVEHRGDYPITGTRRVQHVMVDTASTHFEVPCGESSCQGGGHDLTHNVTSPLRSRRVAFKGSSECGGAIGGGYACARRLEYSFEAKYHDLA